MKKPKTLKDIYVIVDYKQDCGYWKSGLKEMLKEWIKYIESEEKKFIKDFKRQEKQWYKDYEQGMHRGMYEHNLASEWLASVPLRFKEDRAKVRILKEIFNLE